MTAQGCFVCKRFRVPGASTCPSRHRSRQPLSGFRFLTDRVPAGCALFLHLVVPPIQWKSRDWNRGPIHKHPTTKEPPNPIHNVRIIQWSSPAGILQPRCGEKGPRHGPLGLVDLPPGPVKSLRAPPSGLSSLMEPRPAYREFAMPDTETNMSPSDPSVGDSDNPLSTRQQDRKRKRVSVACRSCRTRKSRACRSVP